jgi:hypothetical protein
MFRAPMRQKAFVGSLARLSQEIQFIPREPEIAYERPLKPSLSSCVDADRPPISVHQLVVCFADHRETLFTVR